MEYNSLGSKLQDVHLNKHLEKSGIGAWPEHLWFTKILFLEEKNPFRVIEGDTIL